MKRRLLVCLALFLALMAAAHADKLVTEGWYLSGNSIIVEDRSYILYLGSSNKEILADYGTGGLFIHNNTCQSDPVAKICLDNVQRDTDTRLFKIQIRAYSIAPDITITRKATVSEVNVGGEVTFTVTLENKGRDAGNFTFTDEFPDAIEIVSADGGVIKDNAVVWKGTLKRDGTKELSYKLKPKEQIDRKLTAVVSYWDGVKQKTMFSSALELKTVSALKLKSVLYDNSLYIGEVTNLTINVTNYGKESITVDAFDVVMGRGIIAAKVPFGFTKIDDNMYRWSGAITKRNESQNTSRFFVFDIRATDEGGSEVLLKTRYTEAKQQVELDDVKMDITVKDKGIVVRTNLDDKTLESRQQRQLKIWLQNLNPFAKIKNVRVKTKTNLTYLSDFALPEVAGGSQVKLVDDSFYAPAVEGSSGFRLDINVSYETEFGVAHSATFTDTASVVPVKKLEISHSIGKASMRATEQTEVQVKIRNPRETNLKNIRVSDIVPEELKPVGSTQALISVRSGETVTAYTYKITAPRLNSDQTFVINTTMTYSDADNEENFGEDFTYNVSKAAEVKVLPEEFPLTVTKSIDESEIFVGEPLSVKYVISNPSTDKIARDIRIVFPLQQRFDLIGDESAATLKALNPGETATITAKEWIRPQQNLSQSVEKTRVEYQNQYRYLFHSNSSTVSLDVKHDVIPGAAFTITKQAPARVGNTEFFTITLTAHNSGSKQGEVTIHDGERTFSASILPGENKSFSYDELISNAGTSELPQAVANYTAGGERYRTASNQPLITVEEQKILSITRALEGQANDIDPAKITLLVEAAKEVQQLNITDGEQRWFLEKLSGTKTLSYEKEFSDTGLHVLKPAEASYTFLDRTYEARSEPLDITVVKRELVSLAKKTDKTAAEAGEKVKVTIAAKNNDAQPVVVSISDEGREWQLSLQGNEEQEVSYELKVAESITLKEATATYTYKDETFTVSSNSVEVAVAPEGEAEEAEEKIIIPEPPEEKDIVDKFIDILKAILTWKPFGE